MANEMHDDQARGATYITVDHPAVIATYLHFVVPRYPQCMLFPYPSNLDQIPKEVLAYLDQHQRFCQWYIEVAWQRLPEHLKSSHLAQCWNKFGNLDNPTYKRVSVPDFFDDWRGIQQIPLRPGALGKELGDMGMQLLRGQFRELSPCFLKRLKVLNANW